MRVFRLAVAFPSAECAFADSAYIVQPGAARVAVEAIGAFAGQVGFAVDRRCQVLQRCSARLNRGRRIAENVRRRPRPVETERRQPPYEQWISGSGGGLIARRRKLKPTHLERAAFGEGDDGGFRARHCPRSSRRAELLGCSAALKVRPMRAGRAAERPMPAELLAPGPMPYPVGRSGVDGACLTAAILTTAAGAPGGG